MVINLKNSILISLLFLIFFATNVTVEGGSGISAILILLVSVAGLIATNASQYPSLKRWEWAWFVSIFVFFGLVYFGVIKGFDSMEVIDQPSRLVLSIPVYLYIRRVGVNLKIVLIGIAIGAILSGVYSWYQHVELGYGRPQGALTNAVYFGDIMVLIFAFCLYGALYSKDLWFKLFMLLSSFFALYAVAMSGTRGGWVALISIFLLLIFYNVWNIPLRKRLIGFMVVVLTLVFVYQSPDLPVKSRISTTVNNVALYFSEGKMSSIGYRFEMWKASWLIAKKDNFLGNGIDDYQVSAKKISEEYGVHISVARFHGPHNQYFESLVNEGIFGVIALFAMFLIPLRVALNNIQQSKELDVSAIFVVTILVAYMEFMLSISALVIQSMSLFFAFSMAMFLGQLVYNAHKKQEA